MASVASSLYEECTSPLALRVRADTRDIDFSMVDALPKDRASFDPVSIADLLRNAFVYPPHSVYRRVKLIFSDDYPAQDSHNDPVLQTTLSAWPKNARPGCSSSDSDTLVQTYHRLLCAAITHTTARMRQPWFLQSGGKDSTSMAIALADARPDVTCITYLGGREENELASAQWVARNLGLRHEALVCDPGRAYDRYLARVQRIPLLTADFATLSYLDLVTEIRGNGGDGVLDALGSDVYFGMPSHWRHQIYRVVAQQFALPANLFNLWGVRHSFRLCYALSTMQMSAFERFYPGSRFSDQEVDALFGEPIAARSRQRLDTFLSAIHAARTVADRRRIAAAIVEAASFGKGLYTASAVAMPLAYPYCDARLGQWLTHEVPDDYLIGPDGTNKILVRKHIARSFLNLPYVTKKGCFRFNVCALARVRYDCVRQFAVDAKAQGLLPGAPAWLDAHREHLHNKYFASKFYLLAVVLPWLLNRLQPERRLG
ncbi:asparagine synthase-related protein [Dyella flagellata]|uniref:Asparagine synthetase domain-containing protein n=1 Tax=Dyella flagellata TaxID=1867833 RepID=A0ABQ5X716_9GAMM|nr:asparagine synthase-related protein [Dyella flagellata]GLQ87363.1 hypothetical protein GCM10007898_09290 [Dyella flagellata]